MQGDKKKSKTNKIKTKITTLKKLKRP